MSPPRTIRGALVVAGLLALVAVAVVRLGGNDRGASARDYRVDVIFDVARGIAPKQVVKVAGAQVGTVVGVRLTPGYQARVQMRIDRRFAPFRADARCAIRPEGLISENFVDCSPGTPAAALLPATGGHPPTVPVTRTSAPVSLQDLLDIWRVPTAQRVAVLVDELGLGVAGRGSDLNAILYRANPTLAAARRAIALVDTQRRQLGELVDAAAPVVGSLAQRRPEVQRFITQTARLSTITGTRRDQLSAAIAHLPPLLRSAAPALRRLDQVATAAPPLLADLRAAAPALTRLSTSVPPFSATAVGTLRTLDGPVRDTALALRRAAPVVRRLASFAHAADPAGIGLARLLVSLRDDGAIESLLHGVYSVAGLANHYDRTSHVIHGLILANACTPYARTPTAGCSARLDGSVTPGSPVRRSATATRPRRPTTPAAPVPSASRPPAGPGLPASAPALHLPALPARNVSPSVGGLLDFLLG